MFFFFNYTAPTVIYTTDTRFPDTTLFRSNGRARRRRRGGRSPARPGRPLMHVVATAGHVDHGKSTLVLHLTGTDPDRLAEEKARGLTIDLGFRSEEHTSELQSLMRISYAVFCLKKKNKQHT